MSFREPKPLVVGSRIAVVAPAGPFKREWLFEGLAWLRTRYELRIDPSIFEREGYLAGSDERRAQELARAMVDPEIDAILCARGGYGAMRILDRLPWEAFAKEPKWLIGFSDVTALHLAANKMGVRSLHAPNGTGTRAMTPRERFALVELLEGRESPWAWQDLDVITKGEAKGPVVGGNLALVCAMAAAGGLEIPQGAIVVLEDVTERPYRVDRMLTSLLLGGHLAQAGAIVFGGFTECEPAADGVTVDEVLRDRTSSLGVPVVMGAPFGHGPYNEAFVLGRGATVRAEEKGTVTTALHTM